MKYLSAFLLAVFVAFAPPALADDVSDCAEVSGDKGLAACTRAITSGKFRGKALAEIFYNRGVLFQDEQQVDRAIADYNEAIKLDPTSADAFFNRGRAYTEKADHDRAIADYTASISIDASFADAFNNRGRAYQEKGDIAQALANFNQAIKINPQHARAHENRGDVFIKQTKYKEALADYETALKLDPQRVWSLYGRGIAKLKSGDEAGGKKDIDAANAKDKEIAADYNKELGVK